MSASTQRWSALTERSEADAPAVRPASRSIRYPDLKRLLIFVAVILTYFVAGKLGLRVAIVHPSATAIWAPSGIALAACLLFGRWAWPAIFVGAFLVNATGYGSVFTAVGIAIGNTLEAVIGAFLVQRFARGRRVFDRTSDAFRFVIAVLVSTAITATLGVITLCVGGYGSWSAYGAIWLTWWLGDATGDLIVAPMLLLWAANSRLDYGVRKTFEAALLLGSLLIVAMLLFRGELPLQWLRYPHSYLFTPILLWAAFRFGPRETATATLILSTVSLFSTLSGSSPFFHTDPNVALLSMQAFVAMIGTTFLIVSIEVEARRKLDEMHWRMAAIVDSSDDAIIATTPKGRITSWNAGAERMYGFSAAEAIGKPISLIIPPELMGEAAKAMARVNDGEMVPPFESVRRRKDGTRVAVSVSISPVKDNRGRLVGSSKIVRDITQLRQVRNEREMLLRSERAAREAAERANRAKDDFLAMLSHELRNPLQAISIASRLLKDPQRRETAHGILDRQVEHVSHLLDDLLDVTRFTRGEIVLDRRPTNLAELASQCVADLRATGQLERHSLETELEPVWVDGDPDRLLQVLINLLGNAVKYTPSGGNLRLRVRADDDAIIEVEDDGIGIPSEALPRVFDLLARGELGLQRSPGGLGIGLNLVKRIVELHRGRVDAASAGVGRGSVFTVSLPRIPAPRSAHADAGLQPQPNSSSRRILVVEDNDDARRGLSEWLRISGHQTFEAANGPDGVKQALEVSPDIALIDLGLPGLDGYQVAAQIRSAPQCRQTKLIALTGYGQREYRADGARAGFHGYLVKPVDPDELIRIIESNPF